MGTKLSKELKASLKFAAYFLITIWVIHLIQVITGTYWGSLGVKPHDIRGLKGVIFSPLIHGDFGHLISNSAPIFLLMLTLRFFYAKIAYRSFFMIYILTGLAVWLFARGANYHIGASGVVYGLVAFIFWLGVFRVILWLRSDGITFRQVVPPVILALIMLFLYSGYFAGIVPNPERANVSWESHLMGALIGIFAAFWYQREVELPAPEPQPDWAKEEYNPQNEPYFFERDTFEKTKEERRKEQENRDLGGWFS